MLHQRSGWVGEIMEVSDLIGAFNRRIDEMLEPREELLISGGPENYSDYTGLVGFARGLKEAKREMNEIIDEWIRKDLGGDEE